ncbi:MAG: xylulokinase [Mycoplasmatales bacterium]
MAYIGIDLGTSSIKALLVDDDLKIINSFSKEYSVEINENGWSEQSPTQWLDAMYYLLKKCLITTSSEIKAISFSGQMHGLVILDENDNVIRPAILWNDQRTTKQCDYLNNCIGKDKLIKWTGNYALTGFTAPKLLWLKEHEPDNFLKIKKIMLPKDFLAYSLTNNFCSDVSDLSGTLFFDVKNKEYSKEMLKILNINLDLLPTIYESNQQIGQIAEHIKKLLALDYDINVVIGGGDQAVGALGTGCISEGEINISLGTSGVVFSPRDEFFKNEKGELHSFCDATGKFMTMGVMLNATGSLSWWYETVLQKTDYTSLEKELLMTKFEESLFFYPYLNGERSPINNNDIRGSFEGLSIHHSQNDMTRSIVEGVSFCLKQIYDSMNLVEIKKINVTGGGSKNTVWLQILANIFQRKIYVRNTEQGPAFGACILAKSGYEKLAISDICSIIIAESKTFVPNQDYSAKYFRYNQKYSNYKK